MVNIYKSLFLCFVVLFYFSVYSVFHHSTLYHVFSTYNPILRLDTIHSEPVCMFSFIFWVVYILCVWKWFERLMRTGERSHWDSKIWMVFLVRPERSEWRGWMNDYRKCFASITGDKIIYFYIIRHIAIAHKIDIFISPCFKVWACVNEWVSEYACVYYFKSSFVFTSSRKLLGNLITLYSLGF